MTNIVVCLLTVYGLKYKYGYITLLFIMLTDMVRAQSAVPSEPGTNSQTIMAILFCVAGLSTWFFLKYRALKKESHRQALLVRSLQTDLDVNRALLNPHFIFNSLSALQNFILTQDHQQANNRLVKFSKLIRKMLESNISNTISLEQELALVKSYLQFKDLDFPEKIEESVTVDPSIPLAETFIPLLMVQPFIENAIWHGLLKSTGQKSLAVSYALMPGNYILCVVDDNGIGRKRSGDKLLEKKRPSTVFIQQRLDLLNLQYGLNCSLTIEDKPSDGGTKVKLLIPVLKK